MAPPAPSPPPTHGYAATVHPLATEAALEAMKSGGNAVDGAIAAAAMLGVVDGHNSGIGGGCFLLIRKPDGTFLCLDGREKAPAAATRDMFVRDGKAQPRPLAGRPPRGRRARLAGRPGGSRPHLRKTPPRPRLRSRRHGSPKRAFLPDPGFAARIEKWRSVIEKHPATAAILLAPLTGWQTPPPGPRRHLPPHRRGRARLVLPRSLRRKNRRLDEGKRRPHDRRRFRRLSSSEPAAPPLHLPRPRSHRLPPAQFRRRACRADPEHPRNLRSEGHGRRLAGLHPHRHRSHETRLRRPRPLARRPRFHPRPARPDRPRLRPHPRRQHPS